MNPHYIGDNGKTKLSIEIANLQMIEINSNEITLSMHVEIKWSEYRLTMRTMKGEVSYLRPEDKGKIWSPKIFIANNTKVTCDMDFRTFPFDKHVCSLEVSLMVIHIF